MEHILKSIENTVKVCALSIWGAYTIVTTAMVVSYLSKDTEKSEDGKEA